MTVCKYDFSRHGVRAMANDTLDLIFSALNGENKDFKIEELELEIHYKFLTNIQVLCFCLDLFQFP